jgi:2-polyprenyl-6-methoxyphenol hydroxylase-like FAD-dependent oxidoreductase
MANSTHESRESWETTSVIICGCGPTGAMLSAYLGRMSVPNVVLEKEPDITTDPRGIALDEDGIRLLQGLGLYDKIYTDIGSCMGVFNFVGGTAKRLDTKPFMRMDYNTTEGGTGHVGFICHKQPFLERHLRDAATGTGHADIRCTSTLTSIEEDEEWVYVKYVDGSGEERRIRGKFLAGADGKTGFTRKRYLEPKGIHMEKASQ